MKGQGRTNTASGSQLRWGRVLVAAQLALSLPLLVGSGLLLRTLVNLQNVDLGYAEEKLLVARVDAEAGGYTPASRLTLFNTIASDIRHIPGVGAVSYSENGLFSGSDSADEIEVEGYVRKGKDNGARWDQVGPDYFSVTGIPILLGREVKEQDTQISLKICIINEAFAKKFFDGRSPIGNHITTIYGDTRNVHQIAGVVKDARTHSLRRAVDARYFVPVTQPLGDFRNAVFTVRATGDPAGIASAVRQTIQRIDGTLPVTQLGTVEQRLSYRMAQDRTLARLAVAFGLVALLLSAIGLYGVLSYSVERRRPEIGIRMALGAEPLRVVRMIVGETGWLVAGGLLVGAGLAVAATRLIQSQLFGLTAQDPATMGAAILILLVVALGASFLPANRAARIDPIRALRHD